MLGRLRPASPIDLTLMALGINASIEADLDLALGQDRHLPHEAWHLVQQAQGREAVVMGAKALASA